MNIAKTAEIRLQRLPTFMLVSCSFVALAPCKYDKDYGLPLPKRRSTICPKPENSRDIPQRRRKR
jgi:hypothetical protein